MKVETEKDREVEIIKRVLALGIAFLSEWDALEFLYRHPSSLCSQADIARLIGRDKVEIGEALSSLENLGLIERSRVSQGIRFYRVAEPADAARRSCLVELMSLARNRTGRLLLLKHLKYPRHDLRRRRDGGIRLAGRTQP